MGERFEETDFEPLHVAKCFSIFVASQVSVNKVMASMRCVFPSARHVELTNCIACELHVTLTQQPTNITYMRQHIHTLDLVRGPFINYVSHFWQIFDPPPRPPL